MSVAFLTTSPYQLFHYKRIAQHLSDVVLVLEVRDTDFGLTDALALEHIPHAHVEYVSGSRLTDLDGRFDAIVCQTPILPLEFLSRSLIVAQQYSMAKEVYQYGVWRAQAHLNLMYGEYSTEKVRGFSNAVAVGNPLLDPYFANDQSPRVATTSSTARLLYMPTYGDLSSLHAILPYLQNIDAHVTVKLHHATERLSLPEEADNINIIHSDVDPVDLFRTHDVVLSDFSGAAYDALYAGVPLILTGDADYTQSDYSRLSVDEANHRLISRAAALWRPGADLFKAIDEARELVDSPLRAELIGSYFTNAGTAGLACAERINELVEKGEVPSFSTTQVRSATRRYVLVNRDLRAQLSEAPQPRLGKRLLDMRLLRRAYRRARRMLARSQVLRSVYRKLSSERRPSPRQLGRRTPPQDQREAVWQLLAPFFEAGGIRVARINDAPGATIAFTVDRLRAFRAALRSAGAQNRDLEVRVLRDRRTTYAGAASSTPEIDVVQAHAFRIGMRADGTTLPPHGLDGYLTALPVRFDVNRKRYITLDVRAEQVDWTDAFGQPGERQDEPAPTLRRRSAPAPIDVVYTWVDSSDPDWRQLHARYSECYDPHHESANNDERYVSRDELRHSLRSLWMFAPFVRHIYLVTMDQRPPWLADHPDISVIPHKEIFPDPSVLPTFNSHAIEACLHRIDGLSEKFLYFNDDVFLGRETTEGDYYTKAGLAKVRLAPTQFVYKGKPEPSAIPTDWAAYNASEILWRDLGIDIRNKVMHTPLPLKKSVIDEIEGRYGDAVERTRAARFRSQTDIAVPSMFAQYYAIGTGRATEWPASTQDYQYVDTGRITSRSRYDRIRQRSPKFFCLNVTRYNEISLGEQASLLAEFLADLYPEPAPWELVE